MAMDFPSSPSVGQIVSLGGNQYIWDGAAWNNVPQQAPAAMSDLPPANPAVGQFWWRGTNGQLYVYVNDGNTSQWVQAAGGNVTVGGPAFHALLTTDTSVANGQFQILFTTEVFDRSNNFASSTFTAPVAGVYHFDACLSFSGGTASTGFYGLELRRNAIAYQESFVSKEAQTLLSSQISCNMLLAQGDAVTVYQTLGGAGGTPVAQAGRSYFSGHICL